MAKEMSITATKQQSWSTILAAHTQCPACGAVEGGFRTSMDDPCPSCLATGVRNRAYFPVHIHVLIDLMQEQFFLKDVPTRDDRPIELETTGIPTAHFGLVITFCTLWEVLLRHFLKLLMVSKSLPSEITNKLLIDNRYWNSRIGGLFQALTGDRWRDAVTRIQSRSSQDYRELISFYEEVREARNQFLHEGFSGKLVAPLPERCAEKIGHTCNFFVCLHNEFIPIRPRGEDEHS